MVRVFEHPNVTSIGVSDACGGDFGHDCDDNSQDYEGDRSSVYDDDGEDSEGY